MRSTTLALVAAAVLTGSAYGDSTVVHHHQEHTRAVNHAGERLLRARQANEDATTRKTTTKRVRLAASTKSTSAAQPTRAPTASSSDAQPKRLIEYKFNYEDIPYQVNPYAPDRGPQSGYNICNATTAGPDSQCQTAIINSMSDFCLWGAGGNHTDAHIGDVEGGVVAYCLNPARGGRQLPPSALKGMQMVKTNKYVQIVGKVDLTALNFDKVDEGGELDPSGADGAGNPIGGLVYSSNDLFGGDGLEQVRRWNLFYDSGLFCLKICNLQRNDPNYCLNTYDTLACRYNMPSSFYDDETRHDQFVECDSGLQDVVGEYKQANGATATWSLPRPLPPDATLPYTPRVPASSNCKTYDRSALFAQATVVSAATTRAATTAKATGSVTAKHASLGAATSSKADLAVASSIATGAGGAAAATSSIRSSATSARAGHAAFGVIGAGVVVLLTLALVA
ncbi:hypothetical protein ACM66B_004629 [Microbotryomycetes sp. NB124-2]